MACVLTHIMNVAPLVGAWIEIQIKKGTPGGRRVAPLVGAWIEITAVSSGQMPGIVAPLVGAWIEITPTFIIT